MLECTRLVSEERNLLNVLKINIAHKRISNISVTHERIITQKRINKAFRIWQESCSRTTWKALAYHYWYAYHSLRTTALWSQNGSFETSQSCQFLNRYLFRSSPLVMNLRLYDWKNTITSASGRNGIFAKSARRDTSRQVRSCGILRVLNVEPLLRIERSQLCWFDHVSRMPHERLARQVLLAPPTGKRHSGRPRTRWSDYISDFARSRLDVESAELPEIAVDRELIRVPLGLLPPGPSLK